MLSLRVDAQLVAKAALGNQQGSVVVMDPKTGAIIAMYSNPSFDPQPLAGHDPKAVQAYWELLNRTARTRRCSRARTASATHRARRSRS